MFSIRSNLNRLIKSVEKKKYLTFSSLSNPDIGLKASSPSRACLYVPGNDSKKLSKIFATNADCIVLDCEDGVALNKKSEAREKIRNLFDSDERVQNNADGKFTVRINPAETSLAFEDIKTIFTIKQEIKCKNTTRNLLPKCIFIPKTNNAQEIGWLFETLHDQTKQYKDFDSLNMFFYMESAISLINLNDIIKTALSLSAEKYHGRFNLEGFVFGSDDFCADIGASRTKESHELIYARQKLVTYCKAYRLKAIDMVYIDFKDLEGLKTQCEQGARMGFTGKQVIHPGQVDVCQNAFTPSKEKVEWATGLVEAFEHHQKSGAGAFTYKGQMIDMPSLLQAKNILKIIEKVKII